MFLSGAVKLASGDPTWRGLTALDVHFETQPLPTLLAWYAHHLPRALLHFGTVATFVIELLLPFLIFAPRNARLFAAGGFLLLEFLIVLTGNYNFFNLLTIVLCLGLLDDRALGASSAGGTRSSPPARWGVVVAAMALLGALQIHQTLARDRVSGWETALLRTVGAAAAGQQLWSVRGNDDAPRRTGDRRVDGRH